MIDEFLAAWYQWTHYRRNGTTRKEQLKEMDKDNYEDIELEEDPKR